ncbi:PA0069 family radical SAM protein [Alkalicaulis satelles]|uniref:PA0069 family radical SAM protein n=1 Tax=Alkalicaulis satelles TaxID=2609175 RepID=A0A5M6ZK84_9PROT|nr:PA0069 family radical SAM protein [Alkalicaulis satelles]KAA5805236.1 PA0069 family radical SAM protein [Alkalicaulis satelles]
MNARFTPARASAPLPEPLRPRGRGAASNDAGRYERETRAPVDDGWTGAEAAAPKLRTTLIRDNARSIITRNDSPDISFDHSVNPYRGCEHGCVYCFARPSHAYWGYSAGIDFESRIFFKPGAPDLLAAAFRKPGYRPEPILIGANTDAYQPVERQLRLTRRLLETCLEFRHPVSVITKSAGIVRDLDILGDLAAQGLAKAAVSLTTLDAELARTLEPRAATPRRRLDAIRALTGAGVPVTVMTAPIIPGLNDHEIEALIEAAAGAGARQAGYVLLRLPLEVRDLFRDWLDIHRPNAAAKIMSLIRQTRGGKDYDARWHVRGVGEGPVAALIATRFRAAIRRHGLDTPRLALRTDLFRVPPEDSAQMSLF